MEKKELGNYVYFLLALLVAAFVFTFGILMGIFIENARANFAQENFAQLEVELLDARLLSDLITNTDCETAIQENTDFADRVFFESLILDDYQESAEISETIKIQHEKYDLLRSMIWLNSIKIKEKCGANYHNVVYIYQFDNPGINKKAEQETISNILIDLKNEKKQDILLISIAGDTNLPSIELLKKKYDITYLPTVIIDENIKIENIEDLDKIGDYVK